jgi:hypothetical protein
MPLFTALLAYLGLRQAAPSDPYLKPGARLRGVDSPRSHEPWLDVDGENRLAEAGRRIRPWPGARDVDSTYRELYYSHLDLADGLAGLPVRRSPGGEVIGRVISERGTAEGLEVAVQLEEMLGVDLGLAPWQAQFLGGMSFDLGPRARDAGEMPASLEPAEVERWRVASGLPAQLARRAEQLDALRPDLERLALESRWGTSAGRRSWAAFMAAGGGTLTPWQAWEAALKFAATYLPGGLEDDRPSGV